MDERREERKSEYKASNECRRCEKELPVGQHRTCPFCGVYLDTIITPRAPSGRVRSEASRRATKMTLLSLLIVIILVSAIVPLILRSQRLNMEEEIINTFHELNGNIGRFTEDEWDMRLTSFSIAITNYRERFPREDHNITLHHNFSLILNGFDPNTRDEETGEYEFIGETEQLRYNQHLIDTAQDTIIDIANISFNPPNHAGTFSVEINLENRADLIISEVRFAFRAYDEHGRPSNGSTENDNLFHVRTREPIRPGESEDSLFFVDWGDRNISSVQIDWLVVEYGPNAWIFMPRPVVEELWG